MQLMNVSNKEMTMTTLEIAELTGKRHDNVLVDFRNQCEALGVGVLGFQDTYKSSQNKDLPMYVLPKDEVLCLISGYDTKARMAIIKRWQELEDQSKKNAIVLPDFTNPAEAARAWIVAYEEKQAAIALANHAIATKAEIGNRREATAMNTASQAVKKATALEIQLDRSKEYASIKRMEMLYHGQKFEWRKLKATGQEMGIEPIEIFDANYGTVKAYHKDVWRETYALDIE